MAEEGDQPDKPTQEEAATAAPATMNGNGNGKGGGTPDAGSGSKSEVTLLKKDTPALQDVLRATKMDDEGKFGAIKSLVEDGKLTNKEVVNSVLHLVRHPRILLEVMDT